MRYSDQPNDKNTLYLGAQFSLSVPDHGSRGSHFADLTTNDPEKQKQENRRRDVDNSRRK